MISKPVMPYPYLTPNTSSPESVCTVRRNNSKQNLQELGRKHEEQVISGIKSKTNVMDDTNIFSDKVQDDILQLVEEGKAFSGASKENKENLERNNLTETQAEDNQYVPIPVAIIDENCVEPKKKKKAASLTPKELNIKSQAERSKFVFLISHLLSFISISNDKFNISSIGVSNFYRSRVPKIPLSQYVERLANYAMFSNETLIIAVIYIDRILKRYPSIIFSSFNAHRLLLTGVLVAGKYNDDCFFNNVHYASVGGISHPEINQLEKDFLGYLSFDVHVKPTEYFYYSNLISTFAMASSNFFPQQIHYPLANISQVSCLQ